MKASASSAPRANLYDEARQSGLAPEILKKLDRRLASRRTKRRKVVRSASAVALVLVGLFWAVPFFKDTGKISIPVAERRSIALADGSRAELNARSTLGTDFRYGRRSVTLEHGEAFFSVVSDPSHPFLVHTPAGTVRVTGTQFNVRLDAAGSAEVTLLEGKVALESSVGDSLLAPGEQATLGVAAPQPRAVTASDLDRVIAWRRGQIVLDGLPLAEACRRFADFHGCTFALDPSVPDVHLGGTYSIEDLPQFLEALKATGRVSILPQDASTYRVIGR